MMKINLKPHRLLLVAGALGGLLTVIVFFISPNGKLGDRRFDPSLWQDVMKRHECVDDLVGSKQLLALSHSEVEKRLGPPNRILHSAQSSRSPEDFDSEELWYYVMDPMADRKAFDSLQLIVVFDASGHCKYARILRN